MTPKRVAPSLYGTGNEQPIPLGSAADCTSAFGRLERFNARCSSWPPIGWIQALQACGLPGVARPSLAKGPVTSVSAEAAGCAARGPERNSASAEGGSCGAIPRHSPVSHVQQLGVAGRSRWTEAFLHPIGGKGPLSPGTRSARQAAWLRQSPPLEAPASDQQPAPKGMGSPSRPPMPPNASDQLSVGAPARTASWPDRPEGGAGVLHQVKDALKVKDHSLFVAMTELMWRGYFCDGRILFPEEGRESMKLSACNGEDEFEELVDEIYTDYDSESSIWSTSGFCIVDGEEISVDDISKAWVEVGFYGKHRDKISSFPCCGVYIDTFKGYSQAIEIEGFDPSLLRHESGCLFYGEEELFPEDYQGTGGERALFKQGERVRF